MNQRKRQVSWLLVVALLGTGYAYYRAQTRQAATLARITALETCLTGSNQQRARAARSTVFGISEAVRKNHNQAKDVAVLRRAQEINGRTMALLNSLHHLRQSWQSAGHRPELQQLPAQLDQYIAFIKNSLPDVPTNLASAYWLENFEAAAPKPVTLAQLTRLETQVRQLESEALAREAQKISGCWWFEKIGAFAIPVSETVAPSSVYQAQLLLVLASSSGRMHFSANGEEMPINSATGQGVVQFKVPAARPGQPDTVRAEWRGRVQMPWGAADTTLETTVPYLIIKTSQR